eukprot:gene5307-biopygen7174
MGNPLRGVKRSCTSHRVSVWFPDSFRSLNGAVEGSPLGMKRTVTRAWRGHGAGYRHFLAWGGGGVARAWRGHGAGVARAWRGLGAGMARAWHGRGAGCPVTPGPLSGSHPSEVGWVARDSASPRV